MIEILPTLFSLLFASPEALHQHVRSTCPTSMQVSTFPLHGTSMAIRAYSVGSSAAPVSHMLVSGEHGVEKMSVIVAATLLLNLCTSTRYSGRAVFVLVANPIGYAKNWRRTSAGTDLNREAFSPVSPEAKVLRRLIDLHRPKYFFSLHMTGNIILRAPRSVGWTGYRKSVKLAKSLQLSWGIRDIKVSGSWIAYAASSGASAVLLEFGRRRDGLRYKSYKLLRHATNIILAFIKKPNKKPGTR